MRRYLLVLPFLWLIFSGFLPIAFAVAVGVMAGGMAVSDAPSRPRPWVKPSQITWGRALDRTTLNWQVVALEPQEQQMALLRLRAGYEPEGVFAVARMSDGSYRYVFPESIVWE